MVAALSTRDVTEVQATAEFAAAAAAPAAAEVRMPAYSVLNTLSMVYKSHLIRATLETIDFLEIF